ncbi:MAG: hypothetical protein LIO69_06445 [Oscillospiraceae bacterium]|nr:hypothetical protein [Oscillospiraceae bacterium]
MDSFSPTAVFPQKIDSKVMRKLFIAVYQQEESQFWLNSLFYRAGEESDVLYLDYRFTADEAERMQQEIDRVIDSIFSSFDENTDDYEKLKTFHDYLVTNCTFSKETDYGNTIYGALVDGYAQCEGYAFSYDYLCMLAGIDCFVATGTNSEGDLHAWNVVLLDGEWYHVDCTWDDPILSTADPDFLRHFYFLVCDSDIIGRTHIIDSTYFSCPECSSAENYYEREGLSTSDADEGVGMLLSAAIRAVSEGKKEAAVRFTDQKAYENAVYKLFDGGGIKTVLAAANDYSDKKVQTGKYVWRLDDDLLIIHVSMVYEE